MTRPAVSLVPHDNYDAGAVMAAMTRLLAPLGGMERFVPVGARVVLKPNLVFGRPPEKAVNTHPEIVRAAARLAFRAGAGRVALGDSPGFGRGTAAAKAAGYEQIAREEGVELIEFTPRENVSRDRFFSRLELAEELLDADVVINLPKMKTHGQMLMSLAVKNMFGAVVGARKLQWHYRAGRDRSLFARVLNEIALAARPHLNILDAVVGMDGMGPTAGNPRPVGFLAAGGDAWAVDAVAMDILGLERIELPTLAAAMEHGPHGWENPEIHGPSPESLRPADWKLPELSTLQMHGRFVERYLPGLGRWLRSRISPRPAPNAKCVFCGYCVSICPAGAMAMKKGRVAIDGGKCIRCYCCHELCQHGGMDMRRGGILPRLLGLGGASGN